MSSSEKQISRSFRRTALAIQHKYLQAAALYRAALALFYRGVNQVDDYKKTCEMQKQTLVEEQTAQAMKMIAFMRRNTVTRTKPTADDDGWDFFFKRAQQQDFKKGWRTQIRMK